MKEYFNFDGTAKRQEYWGVIIVGIIVAVIGMAVILLRRSKRPRKVS